MNVCRCDEIESILLSRCLSRGRKRIRTCRHTLIRDLQIFRVSKWRACSAIRWIDLEAHSLALLEREDRSRCPRCSWMIDTRNKVPNVHISIRCNPKGNSIAAVVPYGHLQYSPRAIVLQGSSMYALARLSQWHLHLYWHGAQWDLEQRRDA